MEANRFSSEPILIVDDVPAESIVFEQILRINKFRDVEVCNDPREALKLLSRRLFALAVVDLVMPHMTGEELLTGIKTEFPSMPVVILSGQGDAKTAARCMEKGAADYISKQQDASEIVRRIMAQLERVRSERSADGA
jgi:DNA-binding NtrC family response regulator